MSVECLLNINVYLRYTWRKPSRSWCNAEQRTNHPIKLQAMALYLRPQQFVIYFSTLHRFQDFIACDHEWLSFVQTRSN